MKKIFFLPLSLVLCAAAPTCPNIFLKGIIPVAKQPVSLLCNEGYAVGFSEQTKEPVFSAEHLTKESVLRAQNLHGRNANFHTDDRVSFENQASLDDYHLSGLARGHMTPSGDMPTREARYESFSLTNVVPQNSKMNSGAWNQLEQKTRMKARKDGELFVVTGPAYLGDAGEIGSDKLKIPSHIWKAVYDVKKKDSYATICENIENPKCKEEPVSELEKDIGLKIFSEDNI